MLQIEVVVIMILYNIIYPESLSNALFHVYDKYGITIQIRYS